MIPKVIHYCWFGHNPLPPLALKCIESWRKFLPDYVIKEWNEDNFDVNIIPYTTEAYQEKKYAFVSDYARFWILYHHGGLYFDTDVEVIKPLDDIIVRGSFMGFETNVKSEKTPIGNYTSSNFGVNPGLGLGATTGLSLYKQMLDFYSTLSFLNEDGTYNLKTIVQYTTEMLIQEGLQNVNGIQKVGDVYIYPSEYFCPINSVTKQLHVTSNTRTIHHYAASWKDLSFKKKIKKQIRSILPERWLLWYNKQTNK